MKISDGRFNRYWRATQRQAKEWSQIGTSEHLVRALPYRAFDAPSTPFVRREEDELGETPQRPKDLEFSRREIQRGIESKFWPNVYRNERCVLNAK